MSQQSDFEGAASRLRLALENGAFDSLQPSDFRVFIQEATSSNRVPCSVHQQVSEDLLAVLSSGQLCNNNQIVAATAFCKIISHVQKTPERIFDCFVNLLKEKESQEWTIFLCHGLFQLNCWTSMQKLQADILLEEILSIVKKFCRELTSTCYFAFKVLHGLLTKVHELHPNGAGISEKNFRAVLDIVLCNWENPLNGVRQQNSLVLRQLLLFRDEFWESILSKGENYNVPIKVKHQHFLELILIELSWTMKSKYFLVTSIVQDSNVSQLLSDHGSDIVAGLTTSLSIPYLVPAGSDLYLAVLASLSLEEWKNWFFQPFSKIVSQEELSLEVENIFNYWMNQTLKKFPSVYEDLIGETKNSWFSFVTLHKMGRKECLTEWDNLDKLRINKAVEHYSDKIRSQAISLVCTSAKTSSPPSDEEYVIVQQFLRQNINSDNTALRQNLLKAVTDFVLRIKDVILHVVQNRNDNSLMIHHDSHLKNCSVFLNWLRSFLLFNLGDKCNYQRKITSLEIYRIVLSCFGTEKSKNDSYRRKSNKDNIKLRNIENFSCLFKYESEEDKKALLNCLFNEDNSVRSSSASILISHFHMIESNKQEFEILFKKGKELCVDQMFYNAESGALITQVLVTLAYKSSFSGFRSLINNGSDSFISVLLTSAEDQFSNLQEDLLKAASQGSFLYGTLQALELLTADTSVSELTMNGDHLERLITLIEKVTEYFIAILALKSDSSTGYAPSFGEMGMAIAAVVESSSVECSEFSAEVADDTMSELQLTPAQQLVLSCVWLNLKECSKLCSKLISRGLSVRDSQRCVSVVVSVLRRCRHKGAIESAGLALYHICSHLTRSGEPELINLPEKLLTDFLQMLVGTTAATVSRRSAGLAILVHRLITGDSRPKKPLLHLCVSRLLAVAGDSDITEQAALVDLPQSQALHFLRTLVQESSLREHMAQYTLKISLVALTNLASPVWTIRNAALQLFGALVPKLVGQKPNPEQGRGNYYLAFEELYIHAQPLVEMMLKEFSSAAYCVSTTSHSKLMPLLTLVTNLTLGLESVLSGDLMVIIQQFRESFKMLFKSGIFNVRKLSSKAYALFTTSSRLIDTINETVVQVTNYIEGKDSVIQSENELNSYVLNLTHLFVRFEDDKVGVRVLLQREKEVYTLLERLSHKLISAQCSHFTKSLVFELKYPKSFVENLIMPFNNSSKHSIGFPHFMNKKITSVFLTIHEKDLKDVANFCLLKNSCHDIQYSCLKALRLYIRSKKSLATNTFEVLLTLLKEYLLFRKHNTVVAPLIFEVMLLLLENVKPLSLVNFEKFCCPKLLSYCLNTLFSKDTLPPVIAFLLPITCGLLSGRNPIDMDTVYKVSTMTRARSDPDFDQDIRLGAAKAMIFLTDVVKSCGMKQNESGELIWKACVDLLQDEVAEVRLEASKFVSNLMSKPCNFAVNPYLALEYLFFPNCINQFMTLENLVPCLIGKLTQKSDMSSHPPGVLNPFDHGVKSIYAEEQVISQLAYLCLAKQASKEKDMNAGLKKLIYNAKPETYWDEYSPTLSFV